MGKVPYDTLSRVTSESARPVTSLYHNPDWIEIVDTDRPWLYSCAAIGPLKLRIQLGPEDSPVRPYQVTLHFCELRETKDRGAFKVKVQDQSLPIDLSLAQLHVGKKRIVVKRMAAPAADVLSLELAAPSGTQPILNAVQIKQLD